MPGRFLVGAVLLAAGVLLGLSIEKLRSGPGQEGSGEAEEAEVEPEELRPEVSTATVERGDCPVEIAAMGRFVIAPGERVMVSSPAGGRILSCRAATGSVVEKGAVILEFDGAPYRALEAEAQGRLDKARAELAGFDDGERSKVERELQAEIRRTASEESLARHQLARLEALLVDGLAAEKSVLEARSEVEKAHLDEDLAEKALAAWEASGARARRSVLEAEEQAARAAFEQARAEREAVVVVAPVAGSLQAFDLSAGDRVEPGAAIAQILTGPGRRLVFGVDPQVALTVGMRARWIRSDGGEGQGVIVGILESLSPQTGLREVWVDPGNLDSPPPGGLVVRGGIEIARLEDVLLVPEEAVLGDGERTVVRRVDAESRAYAVDVEVIGRSRGKIAIHGELAPGTTVIIQGGYNLPEGAHVVTKVPGEGLEPSQGAPR